MSKRNSDGDVLANKLSLRLANRQKLLAAMMGAPEDDPATGGTSKIEEKNDELIDTSFGHDRLGVGGILPKDVADGSFTKKNTITNDRLLEQLIGKKRAKAHLVERAGPQQAPKTRRRPEPKKEESDDEEEGRAATFKSKRRKVVQPKQVVVSDKEAGDGVDAPSMDKPEEQQTGSKALEGEDEDEDSDVLPAKAKPKSLPSRGTAKPNSYLDELLAERSKKKKSKSKNKAAAET